MPRRWPLGLLLLASCDQVFGLDPRPSRPNTQTGMPSCPIGAPFAQPQTEVVPVDGAYSVEAARFTPNQNVAYLSLCPSNGDKAGCEIYSSAFLDGQFTAFSIMAGVSTPNKYDAYPTITPDGHFLLWGAERGGAVAIYVAEATMASFDVPTITPLQVIPNQLHSNEPYLLGDGQSLYLSGGDTANGWDLRRAVGGPPAFGGSSELVPGVNTDDLEFAPVVTDDELEIWFASDRLAPGGPLEIFTATRTAVTEPFEEPTRVDAVSSTGIDWPLWISPDACDLYYINKTTNPDLATLSVAHR
jgi:hypothetical protein